MSIEVSHFWQFDFVYLTPKSSFCREGWEITLPFFYEFSNFCIGAFATGSGGGGGGEGLVAVETSSLERDEQIIKFLQYPYYLNVYKSEAV